MMMWQLIMIRKKKYTSLDICENVFLNSKLRYSICLATFFFVNKAKINESECIIVII